MVVPSFNSPNFGFLAKYDVILVKHAALAERYVFDDANSSLIKLRQFAELLAEHCAAYAAIPVDEQDSFLNLLDKLWNAGVLGSQVSQLFHGIRKSGNEAAHGHSGNRREALHQLQMARKLAIWFHRTFGNDRTFEAGSFVVPPDPAAAEKELLDELNRLREAEVAAANQAAHLKTTLETELRQKAEAESKAKLAYDDLDAALELAAESEQQLATERKKFLERLNELLAKTAAEPVDKRNATVTAALAQDASLELDEQATRHIIDSQLREAGWEVDSLTLRHSKGTRPAKGRNIAIAEWPTKNGPADYLLFVGLCPVASIEAKKFKVSVANRVDQAARYSKGFQTELSFESNGGPWREFHVPFAFASNGRPYLPQIAEQSGVWFHDLRETTNKPRALKTWYTPQGLADLLAQDIPHAEEKLTVEPLDYLPLYDFQKAAIEAVESQLAAGHRRILIAMATGTGKTRTCLGMLYRFIKSNRFRRVLFLVDRTSLGEQAEGTFENVRLENHQSFDDIYDIKKMGALKPDSDTRLQVATVQGMCKRILGNEDSDPVPVDWYDCIIVDECHRGYALDMEMSEKEMQFRSPSDYLSRYRQVLDHFDAVRIGLTATPAQHTSQIFGPPIFEYSYRQAVIDDYLCDHEPPYRFITDLATSGMVWQKGDEVDVFHSGDKTVQKYQTPDEIKIEVGEFNKRAITENFNRVICRELINHIDFDGSGKTLIYCVNDDHADRVVRILKEELDDAFGAFPNDAVKKITGSIDKPSETIRRFKNEFDPRVAVTVDLLTTGIDVPEITNLVFLRRVSSRILYDQMLGRATRKCSNLYGDGQHKTAFRIFDSVDLYNALLPMTDMKPVVARPSLTFGQLVTELRDIEDVEFTEESKRQLLGKLRRRKLTAMQEEKMQSLLSSSGASTGLNTEAPSDCPSLPDAPRKLSQATNELCDLLNAKSPKQIAEWFDTNVNVLAILDDTTSAGSYVFISQHQDLVRSVETGYGEATKPEDYIESFRKYVTENKDKIPALIVVTTRPRDLTRAQLRELKLVMDGAGFTEQNLRVAVRETTNQDIAASIIAYIRHVALGQPLVPHSDRVRSAMKKILASRSWTEPQRKWLERIGKQLEHEIIVDRDALDAGQFKEMGGFSRLDKVFRGELETILRDIADAMWQAA
jgi:type I restriction enzyme R subunit